MLLALAAIFAPAHTYTHKVGYIGKGGDVLPVRSATLAEAESACSAEPACVAITFEASEAVPRGMATVRAQPT